MIKDETIRQVQAHFEASLGITQALRSPEIEEGFPKDLNSLCMVLSGLAMIRNINTPYTKGGYIEIISQLESDREPILIVGEVKVPSDYSLFSRLMIMNHIDTACSVTFAKFRDPSLVGGVKYYYQAQNKDFIMSLVQSANEEVQMDWGNNKPYLSR